MRWLNFAASTSNGLWCRSRKPNLVKLSLESLEDRRCLAGDMGLSEPQSPSQTVDTSSQIATNNQEHSLSDVQDQETISPSTDIEPHCSENDLVDDYMAGIDECDALHFVDSDDEQPVDSSVSVENHQPMLGHYVGGTNPMTSNGEILLTVNHGLPPFAGTAESDVSTAREPGPISGSNTVPIVTLPHEHPEATKANVAMPPAPRVDPTIAKSEPRPIVLPVETLQVQSIPWSTRLDGGPNSQSAVAIHSSFAEMADREFSPAESAVFAKSSLNRVFFAAASRGLPENNTPTRPKIESVAALVPSCQMSRKPQQVQQKNTEDLAIALKAESGETELQVEALLVKISTSGEFDFVAKNEEYTETRGKDSEEGFNPLCFVLLVGLVGLPQWWKNRLLRIIVMRDRGKTPRPIPVVPRENNLSCGEKLL